MGLRSFLRVLGSLRFAAVVLVMLCIAMACATVYEVMHGTAAALSEFYKSAWFQVLLGLLAVNVLASMLARYPWSRRHVGFLLTHTSILVILGGAWISQQFGIDGQVSITEGQTASRFITDQDTLNLRKGGQLLQSVDLFGGVGGMRPKTRPSTPPLRAGEVLATIEDYVPDSRLNEEVVDDAPEPALALEVSLSATGQTTTAWVFAGQTSPAGVPVTLRSVHNAADVDQFLAIPATQPARPRLVKAQVGPSSFEFSLERCLAGAVELGDTGYSVKVLRYLPHALVGENKQLISASDRPVNPAIEAEIVGPNGTSKRFAFAKFPDFGSMHGTQDPAAEVKITLDVPTDQQSAQPIEILAGPEGRLAGRFTPEAGTPVSRELTVGEPVQTPWSGLTFTVLRRFEHGQRRSVVQPVVPPGKDRTPAITVLLRSGEQHLQVWVRKYEPRTVELGGTRYELAYDDKAVPLGFEVRLNDFNVGTYPGSGRPRTFESNVTLVNSSGAEEGRTISMNHPVKFGGYSLFQSSYRQGRRGPATSILSVSWDPGQPIVFAGYVTLIIGMLYVLINRMSARSSAGKPANRSSEPTAGRPRETTAQAPAPRQAPAQRDPVKLSGGRVLSVGLLALLAPLATVRGESQASLPRSLDLSVVRVIPVQHDGRWMPLDTLARDEVDAVTGEVRYRGKDPVLWLLAWTFNPRPWLAEPLITIGSAELRQELKLPEDREEFSYAELVSHQPLQTQIEHLSHRSGGKLNPLESKVSGINKQLVELQDVFSNQVIRPIPDPDNKLGAWKPIALGQTQDASPDVVQSAWSSLRAAFLTDNAAEFNKAAASLSARLADLPAAHRPDPRQLATELRYNRLAPYSTAWKLMVLGAVLAAAALLVRQRWFDAIAVVAMLAGFLVLSYGLWLRWHIAGRIPAANMFESLLFLSWGAGAFAILSMLVFKDRSVPLTASAIGALALFLADTLPLDHFIRPIAPVLLDTVWMSIHVPGIMVSYAVLALAALIAHVQMFAMAAVPNRQKLIDDIDRLHYWYLHVGVILLGAGIITGSMWAASSWGRYWGWDPKEVWSLIAFVAYLVIMHVRVDRERSPAWLYGAAAVMGVALFVIIAPKLAPLHGLKLMALVASATAGVLFVALRGRFAMAFKSAVAFWFIIMTYIGVNYVLGIGLHSYGFGTGAVVHYMMLTGSIDLLLVIVLAAVYLVRTRRLAVIPEANTGCLPTGRAIS